MKIVLKSFYKKIRIVCKLTMRGQNCVLIIWFSMKVLKFGIILSNMNLIKPYRI